MSINLVLDAQLSKDSYGVNNSGTGTFEGWKRVAVTRYELPTSVETGSNFAALLYQGPAAAISIFTPADLVVVGLGAIVLAGGVMSIGAGSY